MAGIDQNTLWQLASMILGKPKAQPTTRERATFLRTDSDGTQWVRLPSSNDETPVNGRTLATAKAGDTVEWSIDDGRLSITGNSTSPSVGMDYVGQEVSVVTKQINQVKADAIETNELLATKATIGQLEAESARIDELEADHVSVSDFEAEQASIDSLQAATADIDTIRANSAKVQNLTAAQLEADHATIGTLDTTYMHANMSNSDVAWIENGTIKNGAIVSAMINDVSANKLTAGTINGSVINVTNLNADNITAGTINGQRIGQGSLSLDKLSEDVYTETEVDSIVDGLNDRIDGAIQTHTGTAVPTLNNSPASSWNTTALKDEHVGDVYYVVNSQSQQNGYCYRFTKSGSTYSWQLIKDSDVTAALSRLTTAEGKITSIESFDSTVSSFMTNTDSELTSVKSRATSLETRMTDAEGDISEKVDTSTFNTLSQTVDGNSASITSMGTVLSNNGLTSSTNITNTVNTVSQTASGNSSKITQLTTTLGTNADGTTKAGDVMHRTSAVEQDLSGFKTTVSQTYATNTTVDGIATRVTTAESNITQNANNIALKVSESDVTGNYLVGKINLNSTTASIAAEHINLQGAVTISDLSSDAQSATLNSNMSDDIYQSAQPNLSPFFEIAPNDAVYWFATGNLKTKTTPLGDGWSHVEYSSLNLNVSPRIGVLNLAPSTKYTVMLEVRNATALTNCRFYLYTATNSVWAASVNTVVSANGTYYLTGQTKADLTDSAITHLRTFFGSDSSAVNADIRLSLYEGEYDGPFKPYSGTQLFATQTDASNAAKTATSYVTDITGGGIMVHPSTDQTTGVQITDDIDILRENVSVINVGENDAIRIGASGNVQMHLESDGMSIDNENGDEIFAIDSGSTGSVTIALDAPLAVWNDTTDVDTTTYTVADTGAAVGAATVTATVGGTDYAMDSTYATATVTAGTGVTVALTSAGVTHVQGLMVDAEVTTGELSVEYQHAVTDIALLALIGRQSIDGEGESLRITNNKWVANTRQSSTLMRLHNATTGRGITLGVGSNGYARGVFDSRKGDWIIARNKDDKTVINGPNFSVDAGGRVNSTYQVRVVGPGSGGKVIALRSNTVGNRGLYDVTSDKWVLFETSGGSIGIGASASDHLYRHESTCTVTTANATVTGGINYCWHNNAVCTVFIGVNLKSSLTNGSAVAIATAPANFRPPYTVVGSVYVTGQNVNAQAWVDSAGKITVNNRSGSTITTSANLYVSFTYAL